MAETVYELTSRRTEVDKSGRSHRLYGILKRLRLLPDTDNDWDDSCNEDDDEDEMNGKGYYKSRRL